MGVIQLSEIFKLDEDGYALIQKLIYFRLEEELQFDNQALKLLNTKQNVVVQQSGFFNSINKSRISHTTQNLSDRIDRKKAWMSDWKSKNLSSLSNALQQVSVEELANRFKDGRDGRSKLFLILQEVVQIGSQDDCAFAELACL